MTTQDTAVTNGKHRKRKNFRIPSDLADWAEKYAQDKNTSMTQLIVDYLTDLRERETSSP
jgi:hypothetical protein